MGQITACHIDDVRFPTSQFLDGSDAMNPDPDYSAAYVRLDTSDGDSGHGFVFTIGRGNDVQSAANELVAKRLIGRDLSLLDDLGAVWRELNGDSQLRWLGPEKGVMHMAIGAVINALWDLKAKRAGLPLWQLLSRMSPEELVGLVDFRYLTDALTPDEALVLLRSVESGRAERESLLLAQGYPRLHDDARVARLRRREVGAAVARGGGGWVQADQAQGGRRPGR